MKDQHIFPYKFKYPERACRLYCFHHAGGSAFIFKNWLKFSECVEVIPVEIPDREKDMEKIGFEEAVEDAVRSIMEVRDERPAFIYGHSLGALLAFQTAYRLSEEKGVHIGKLFVAGRHAPFAVCEDAFKCSDGLEALYEELRKDGGVSEEILSDAIFKQEFLPRIFHDYRLSEEHVYKGEVLDIPIVTLSGTGDLDASMAVMEQWKQVTKQRFKQYEFKGDHFFPYGENEKDVLNTIVHEIQTTLQEVKNER